MTTMPSQPESPHQALFLTQDDITRLMTEPYEHGRLEISERMAASYAGEEFSTYEAQIAEQIFRLLVQDKALKVRVALADRLKASARIPRDIVLTMAQDVEQVAVPVLSSSEVLTDEDLMQLIRSTKELTRHLAISGRAQLSGNVSEALVDTGQPVVVQALMKNEGARLQDALMKRIVEEFQDSEHVLEALAARRHVPASVIEKIIAHASGNLAEALRNKHQKNAALLDNEQQQAREQETIPLLVRTFEEGEVRKLSQQMHAFGRLTPSLILLGLCHGNWRFFEHSLALLSNVPVDNVRTLLADRGELGFRALYNKAHLPDGMFRAVKMLLEAVRSIPEEEAKITRGTQGFANRVVERLLQLAAGEEIEHLPYLIALVKQ